MLPLLTRAPVQRDREMEDSRAHVAVELAALRRAELAASVIQRCAARAPAYGAGERINGQGRERGHKASLGLRKQPAGSGVRRAHLAYGKKRSCENRQFAGGSMSPNNRVSRLRPDMQPAAFGGFAISGYR